jgi:hypothetical protein
VLNNLFFKRKIQEKNDFRKVISFPTLAKKQKIKKKRKNQRRRNKERFELIKKGKENEITTNIKNTSICWDNPNSKNFWTT